MKAKRKKQTHDGVETERKMLGILADYLETGYLAISTIESINRDFLNEYAARLRKIANGGDANQALQLIADNSRPSTEKRDLSISYEYAKLRRENWKAAAAKLHLQKEWQLTERQVHNAIRRYGKMMETLLPKIPNAMIDSTNDYVKLEKEKITKK